MAWSSFNSTRSPPTTSTPNIRQEKHDVFLSFRGEDTRYTFTSHLHAALNRLHIKTYIDYEIQRGDEISPMLIRAIEGAKVSVIIFSKNYASSKWCLDELVRIIECKQKNGQIVVPIFYHVDPSHVRNQTGSYAEAFARHEQVFRNDMNKVLRWKFSLQAAAQLAGWDIAVNRRESELVEDIAKDVLVKLDSINGGGLDSRIGMQRQAAQAKYDKYLSTSNLNDMKDLLNTLQHLAQLKLEKVLKTNNENDWEDLGATYDLILQLKSEKCSYTNDLNDYLDLNATQQRIAQLLKEKENRTQSQGRPYGI